ncbi:CU044_5270 family protein [Streptomyces sp. NPDC050121]|uniref:CU044_5270 family protein n=1 Tax=Streptomyces sp. NPDC050121 TaxID=3365601 RepID=UPI00379348AD
MNTNNPPSAGSARSEAEELLSAPAEWDLPPSRHLHYKDVLMQQIDRDGTTPATQVSPAPRRRLPRRAVLVPLATMALAGALVVTFSAGDRISAPTTGAATEAARANSASVTLNRIALAAMETDATPVKDGQFVYVRSLVRSNEGAFDGPVRLGPVHERELWRSQEPGPITKTGWIRESGKDAVMPGQVTPIEGEAVPAGIQHPTYKWLASLPTDPDALLKLLYTQTRVEEGESKEQAVFSQIGDLVSETIMPPANASAFYKAAAKIPGVKEIPDAVDAAGRHGIGITREDAGSATRDEWIFDKGTLAYLGSRSYMTKDKARGITTDTLYGTDAVIKRAVVDRHGEEPAKTDG